MPNQTTLFEGSISNHDQLAVVLIGPTDASPELVRVAWPQRPTTVSAATHPNIVAVITRIIAESAIALARHKASRG